MVLSELFTNPVGAVLFLLSIVAAVTVHEFAHAKTADNLGDPTPQLQGRVTLDPRSHLDPIGSLLFLLFGFGWGRPVPYDPYNLKNPQKDAAMIALAGPYLILAWRWLPGLRCIFLAQSLPAQTYWGHSSQYLPLLT
ncbi:MAG: hypothetical protein UZ22_OP11002000380 [Microgenomates bacterium OLB23]|nr:MAG: hypothetical protein UZ22_OP11002000380 [Microgenomates bacterium OLB23]